MDVRPPGRSAIDAFRRTGVEVPHGEAAVAGTIT